jgi:tetratricopeptide (TPR) repeat protein
MSKARDLLDEGTHPLEALGALCGLFNYHLIRSESARCLELIEPRLRAKMQPPASTVIRYLAGTAHLHLGNFTASIDNLEAALRLYDEDTCRPVAFIAGYHLRSFILIWLGLAYLYVGEVARGAQTVAAAVSDARDRSHPFTLVSALLALARFRVHTRDLAAAIEATEEGMAVAAEQRSPYHVSRAAVLRAVNVVESGRAREGIAMMEEALAAHRATGANFQSSFNLSCLARAYALAGGTQRANELALEALADVERTGERWWEAEAWRLRAQIDGKDAKACLERALDCARRQHAKLWQLHAALDLAQLLVADGETERARRLLRPICASFGDGYPLEALAAARRLLDTRA